MADDNTARRAYPYSRGNPDMGSRAAETDPLTELARLIGQTKPFDPPPPANGRDHEWPGDHPPMPRAAALPLGTDYRDDQYGQQPAYDDQHPQSYEQSRYDPQTDYGQQHPEAPYYGDNGQLAPDDPYAPQHYEYDEPPPRRRSGMVTVIAVIGLALLGTAGAYGYRTFMGGGVPAVPPLIKADSGPNKVAPAQQGEGGTNKQIYDRVGSGGQTEKIVSREEQPVDVKPANARPAYVPGQNAASTSAPSAGQAAGQLPSAWPNPPGATVQQQQQQPGQPEPRKVRTVTIRPDQPPGSPAAAAPAPAPVASAPRAAASADAASTSPAAPAPARPAAPAPRAHSNAPLSLTPQGASERVASAEPRAAAHVSAPAAAGGGGGYVVQLSAQKSEGEASAAFRAAQARYPNVLGSRQLIVRRKEIPGKGTFFGAQVGPFASREGANQLCEELKTAGGTCIVQKN